MSECKKGRNNYLVTGYYVTPFGKFMVSTDQQVLNKNVLIGYCKDNDRTISIQSYTKSKYLSSTFDTSIIGKTFKELGFSFLPYR